MAEEALLILDDVEDPSVPAELLQGVSRVTLLSFHSDPEMTNRVTDVCEEAGLEVECRCPDRELIQVAHRLRIPFARMIAEAGREQLRDTRSLKEAFTFENQLSLWWLSEPSSKRSDAYPAFLRLCQTRLVERAADEVQPTSIYVISEDSRFIAVLQQWASDNGVPMGEARDQRERGGSDRSLWGFVRALVGTGAWFLKTAVQTVIARAVELFHEEGGDPSADTRAVFYTHFPGLWQLDGGRDEKYGRVPELIAERPGCEAVYACSMSSDGYHEKADLRSYLRRSLTVRRRVEDSSGVTLHYSDADLRAIDFAVAFRAIFSAWRMHRVLSTYERNDVWRCEGVDLSPYLHGETAFAVRRIPRYILHLLRTRRTVERLSPDVFVTHLFEFCYGRAMVHGAKSSGASPRVVGTQHGPVSRTKLMYCHAGDLIQNPDDPADHVQNVPIPDLILLEGPQAREILVEAGFPEHRCEAVGAPRVLHLRTVRQQRRERDDLSGPPTVLVTFGQKDGIPIVARCRELLRTRDAWQIIFKPHPRSGIGQEDIAARLGPDGSWRVSSGEFYEELSRADVVVGTYSSTLLEAAAVGVPVVLLHLPNHLNSSPLVDQAHTGVWEAGQSGELLEAVDSALQSQKDGSRGEEVTHTFFKSLDAEVETAWVRAILAPDAPASGHLAFGSEAAKGR